MLTALAITAASFAAMVIPASAEVTAYEQDYESGVVDWTSANTGRYTTEIKEESGNHYLEFVASPNGDDRDSNPGSNGTTLDTNTSFTGAAADGDDFVVEFDMAITGSNNNGGTALYLYPVGGSTSNYLFKMSQTAANSNTYKINDSTEQQLPLTTGTWYKYKIAVKDNAVYLQVKDADGTNDVFAQAAVVPKHTSGGFSKMYFDTGRYSTDLKLDNVKVRDWESGDSPVIEYHTVTINTTRYATLTYGEANTKVYADVNGKIEIPLLTVGTEFDYTITKTGYEQQTGHITVANDDITENKPLTMIPSEDETQDYIYVESDFGNADGIFQLKNADRGPAVMNLGEISLPALATFEMDFTGGAEEKQYTWMLRNSAGKDVVGIQGIINEGIYAFTDFGYDNNANADTPDKDNGIQQSGGAHNYGASVKIADSYSGVYHISFVFDQTNSTITVKCTTAEDAVGVTGSLALTQDATTIKDMQMGKYRQSAAVSVDNVKVSKPDENFVNVVGDDEFAVIAGKTVTREYIASPAVVVPGETFTWTAKSAEGTDINGVTIDQSGVLSVADSVAADTTVVITATSATTAEKKGSIEATIKGVQTYTPTVEYTKAVQAGEEGKLTVVNIVDALGDDVTEYFDPTWSIDGATVDADKESDVTFTDLPAGAATAVYATYNGTKLADVTTEPVTVPDGGTLALTAAGGTKVMLWNKLDGNDGIKPLAPAQTVANVDVGDNLAIVGSKSGKILTNADKTGEVTVKLDITGSDAAKTEYKVTVGNYSQAADAAEGEVTLTLVPMPTKVMVYDDKGKATEKTVDTDKITLAAADYSTDATELEITPIYETTMNTEVLAPAGRYNITVTANNGGRTDVYVNDQMIINNLNQGSDNFTVQRNLPATADYTVGDVMINEGYAKFVYQDHTADSVNSIKFVKANSLVPRAKRMYVVGDSLVANYYGTASDGQEGLVRTGWGQVLSDYIADSINVVNLGNSGAWAAGMWNDAWTNIRESAQPGDVVVWEFGYNDTKHGGTGPMLEAAAKGKAFCEENGIDLYVVTPNASQHDFKANVAESGAMRTWAADNNVKLIDLAALSYKFLNDKYGSLDDRADIMNAVYNNTGDNSLHSTYNAANCWAAIVAQGLPAELTDATHTYQFNDTKNDITVGVGLMPTAE